MKMPLILLDGSPSPFETFAADEQRRLIVRCEDALRARQRELLYQRYERDQTFLAIATRFGVTEEAVIAMHGRALLRMRDRLAELGITRLSQIV
jgi:DNA-directed RNA polymerase specialized sigma subunit